MLGDRDVHRHRGRDGERAVALGDHRDGASANDRHYAVIREGARTVPRARGRYRRRRLLRRVRRAGARRPRCAEADASSARCARLGLQRPRRGSTPASARSWDDKLSGIAVHTGARVAALAGAAGEVLVSSTVKDLVAGSGHRLRATAARSAQRRARRLGSVCRRCDRRNALDSLIRAGRPPGYPSCSRAYTRAATTAIPSTTASKRIEWKRS